MDEPERKDHSWTGGLLVNRRTGGYYSNVANAVTVLLNHPDFSRGFIKEDKDYPKLLILFAEVPGEHSPSVVRLPREMTDFDLTGVQLWFQRGGFPTMSRSVVLQALRLVARSWR